MGNCPGCLSTGGSPSAPSFCEEEDAKLITVVRSTDGELFKYPAPLLVKDVMSGFHGFAVFEFTNAVADPATTVCVNTKPLHPDAQLSFNTRYHLKPLAEQPALNQLQSHHHGKPVLQSSTSLRPQETCSAVKRSPKVLKKVRFADEPVLVTSNQKVSQSSSSCNRELQCEDMSSKKQSSALQLDDGNHISQVCFTGMGDEIASVQLTRESKGNSLNGVVRLKVVISKRDLTELMSPKTPEKQAEAMVKRIMAPHLSPQHSSISSNCSQSQ